MSKHHLEVAMTSSVCLICGKTHKDDADVLIDIRFYADEATKDRRVKEMSEPHFYKDCNQCNEYKEMGIILVGFDEDKSDFTLKPSGAGLYRTGEFMVIKEEAFKNFPLPQKNIDEGLERRVMFIPQQFAKQIMEDANS